MFDRMMTLVRDRPQPMLIRRNDPEHARAAFPQPIWNRRMSEVEEAPRPPKDTQFYGVGRDAAHAPTAIATYGGGLAISEWLSVMGWPFGIAKIPSAMVVTDMPMRGKQNPFSERPNIVSPTQTTLGDTYALKGSASWTPNLLKITS